MKRTFARIFAGVALLIGLCLFASQAHAQQSLSGSQPSTQGWKTPEQAKDVCVAQVEYWAPKLDQYAPGTSNYTNVARHVSFYKTAWSSLNDGMAVPATIEFALSIATPTGSENDTPKAVVGAMREEAIELFQQ